MEKKNFNYNKVNKSKEVAKDIPEEVINKNDPEKKVEEPAVPKKLIGIVNSPLNLREAPNKDAKILTVMPTGSRVTLLSEGLSNGFYKIQYNDFNGYAMTQFITKK